MRRRPVSRPAFRPRLAALESRDCPTVTLVSEGGPGDGPAMANGPSTTMAASSYFQWVAFVSEATNLVSGQIDTPGTPDLFLYDGISGSTRLVSHVAGNALQAAGGATTARGSVSITHYGRYVAFTSTATNLVANQIDAAGTPDVFLFDRGTDTTTLVSRRAGTVATAGNGLSDSPSIARDDDPVVAFRSRATDLQSGYADTNGKADVVRHVAVTGTTTYLTAGDGDSGTPLVDRAYLAGGVDIAFESMATNLVAGQIDANGAPDVFRFDNGTTTLISRQAGSMTTTADGGSTLHDHSANIAFTSTATNLVAGQTGTPGQENAFGHSSQNSQVYLFSRPNGSQTQTVNGGSDRVVLNGLGLRALFRSTATNVVAGQVDINNGPDLFMVDWNGAVTPNFSHLHSRSHVSATQTGNQPVSASDFGLFENTSYFSGPATDYVAGFTDANGPLPDLYRNSNSTLPSVLVSHAVGSPTMSSDAGVGGRLVLSGSYGFLAYDSASTNLASGLADTANSPDIFSNDPSAAAPANVAVTRADVASPVSKESDLVTAMTGRVTSADGRYTAYVARIPSLPNGQFAPGDLANVYLYDAVTRTTTLVSRPQSSGPAPGHAGEPSISADGRYVAFSRAYGSNSDVETFDQYSGQLRSVGLGAGATFVNTAPVLSADGQFVVFRSLGAPSGVADTNGAFDIYLFPVTGFPSYTLVSRSAASATTTANGASASYAVSADGSYVAFSSTATNVATGVSDANAESDVFLFNRATGTNVLVSRSAASSKTTAAKGSYAPTVSDDGRYVAFMSYANNVVTGQSDGANTADAFVYDRLTPSGTKLVSRTAASATAAAGGINPKISGDGSAIVFRSTGTNLVAGQVDPNANYDVFVYTRATATNAMVSRRAGTTATAANGSTFGDPTISANGQKVAFLSTGTNFVSASDTNNALDVFVFDRSTGLNVLASHVGSYSIAGNGESKTATISADGSTVLFTSLATNLGTGDANGFRDVFAFRFASGGALSVSAFGGVYVGPKEDEKRDAIRPPEPSPPRKRTAAWPYSLSDPSSFPSPPLKIRPLLAGS
jgi:hypothetical protein